MPDSPSTTARQQWLIIWGALTAAPVMYVVLAQMIPVTAQPAATLPMLRLVFLVLGVLAFGAGAFLMTRASAPDGWPPGPSSSRGTQDLPAPATFLRRSIIAMAFFESIAVYGWILFMFDGLRLHILPWSVASVAALLAIALPSGLSYWQRWEFTAAGAPPPIG